MSDYRVFDKTKNQYDATVMSSLFVDDVPNGFDIALSIDNVSTVTINSSSFICNTEATLTFTSFRQNPGGGNYTWNSDYGLSGTVNGFETSNNRIFYYRVRWSYVNDLEEKLLQLSFKLKLKNETPFSFRIYNVNTNGTNGYESSFPKEGLLSSTGLNNEKINVSYEPGFTSDNLLNIDDIVEGNQEKPIETRITFSNYDSDTGFIGKYTDISMYLTSFSIQRIF